MRAIKWVGAKLKALGKYGKVLTSGVAKKCGNRNSFAVKAMGFMFEWCPKLTKILRYAVPVTEYLQPELLPEIKGAKKIVGYSCKVVKAIHYLPGCKASIDWAAKKYHLFAEEESTVKELPDDVTDIEEAEKEDAQLALEPMTDEDKLVQMIVKHADEL